MTCLAQDNVASIYTLTAKRLSFLIMTLEENMSNSNYKSGTLAEKRINNFLHRNFKGTYYYQTYVGENINNRTLVIDFLLGGEAYKERKSSKRFTSKHKGGVLLEIKTKTTSGSIDDKIPMSCLRLQHAVNRHGYDKGIIVLCGNAWTYKDYFCGLEFYNEFPMLCKNVRIVTEEQFKEMYE